MRLTSDAGHSHSARRFKHEVLELRYMLDAPEFSDGEVMGIVEDPAITAASGLVASRKNADVLWLQNDLGDSRLFAINNHGELLGTFETNVDARDWEDIAVGPGPTSGMHYLYVADTGDNSEVRTEVQVYRVAEPVVQADGAPRNETLPNVATLRFRYPNGSHDTETLIVDPQTGDLYLVTKRDARSQIYRAAYPQSTTSITTLEHVGELAWTAAAAGDITPNGDALILKDLNNVYFYPRATGTSIADALAATPTEVPYISQPLGEGLTFDSNGSGYFTHSEGASQPLYYFARLSSPLAGDFNDDGKINRADVAIFAAYFGKRGSAASGMDLNSNGVVDLGDLGLLQASLATTSADGPASIVTRREPTHSAISHRDHRATAINDLARLRYRRSPHVDLATDQAIEDMSNRNDELRAFRRVLLRRG